MNPKVERFLGSLLKNVRAGDKHLAWNHPSLASAPDSIEVRSAAFAPGAPIPARFAGAGVGENLSPPLHWSGILSGAQELVLIVEDPDVPFPKPIVHLVATGIAPNCNGFPEGALTLPAGTTADSSIVRFGRGIMGRMGYFGPRPPRGHGAHGYQFLLVALSRPLTFAEPPNLATLLTRIGSTALAKGRLIGTFERL